MTANVASGVTSRGESPVPPEVTTRLKSLFARSTEPGLNVRPFVRQNLDGGDFKPRFLKDALCFRP